MKISRRLYKGQTKDHIFSRAKKHWKGRPSRRLESEIGKPVVTSCQAYIWYALESAHVKEKISGYGKLMGTLGE